jgi:transketolase
MDAQARLADAGIAVRVVSMPCAEAYDRQDAAYKAALLPDAVPKVAIEAGVTAGWWKYVGHRGCTIGIDTFGESAPGGALFKHFGLTVEHVVATVRKVLA